ncbi:hypothetical protein CAPN003_24070 [Capnocytophaga stomatis]|nr:hypothetical protein CAPN003_24070 [Capnocytophaga stomatis]
MSNEVRSITTKSGCKIVFDDNAKSVLVEDPSGNKFLMDGAGNIEVNAPKNMTFTVGENFTLNVGKNMNTTIGNDNTISVTNDNMILVQNNHTLNANDYGQTLKGNYTQAIQGNKKVEITGKLDETSDSYTHFAQSGDVIIQSANISKLLGKKDALVNKTGFQKPRYFIEDVSDKKEGKKRQEESKKTLVQELHDDILTKLNPSKYTDNERKYVEGALKHIDFLVDENVNFVKEAVMWEGLYDGKLNIRESKETSKDDLKITLFHEYLHHVNYMEKIYPYRYSDETSRKIFQMDDDCYTFKEPSMNDVFYDFIVFNDKVNDPDWQYSSYEDIKSDKQKQEVLNYKKDNIDNYQIQCKDGTYKPSNYYRDEIAVYTICLRENHNLFVFSDKKENMVYKPNLKNYYDVLQRSMDYEKRNNYDEKGYSK